MPRRTIRPGDDVVELDVHLHDVHPPVWRRIQAPAAATLAELHSVLQRAMGWTDSHLHEFELDERRYGLPDPDGDDAEVEDEAAVTLGELTQPGSRLEYRCDFGDGWRHALSVRAILAAEPGVRYPRCLDGERACPPADVGGPWGYGEFLAALSDPGHEQHELYTRWGGPFDSEAFDVAAAARRLAPLAWADRSASPVLHAVPDSGGAPGMTLRCTGKLLGLLKPRKGSLVEAPASPRDWYANVVRVQGRKCLLVTHAGTLFTVFIPDVRAADLRPVGAAVVPAIEAALAGESLPVDAFGALDPGAVRLAKTADRSVLASMNKLADYCQWVVADDGGLALVDLAGLHRRLHRNPLGARDYAYAVDLVRARLGLDPLPPGRFYSSR